MTRAIQNGRIVCNAEGLIDTNDADRRWPLDCEPDIGSMSPDAPEMSFDEATRRKVAAQAKLAEMEVEKEKGRLIDAEAAARAWETNGVEVRTAILATAPRLAPAIVGMTDVVAVEAAITRELTQALTALADDMPTGKA